MKYRKRSGRARRYGVSLVLGGMLALGSNVPARATAGTVHVVKSGESLGSVARKHKVSVNSLAAANRITNVNSVRIGARLTIPNGAVAASAPASATKTHVVKPGENLGTIARKYGMTTKALAAANGITDVNKVRIGSKLKVSGSAAPAPAPKAAPAPNGPKPTLPAHNALKSATRGKLPSALVSRPERMAYMPVFDKWAAANGVAPDLLKATCWMESGWRNDAVSSTGALGIGQILPSTAKFIAGDLIGQPSLNSRVPEDNIRMSARYHRYLINLNGGNERMALASYYQGYGSIQRTGVRPETVRYVDTIMALRPAFQ